jgi:ribosomal protein L39E
LRMSRNKSSAKKKKLSALARIRPSPRWADIKKFSLKRARSRRIRVNIKKWRRDKLKI